MPVPVGLTMFVVVDVNDPVTPLSRTPSAGLPPLDSIKSNVDPVTIVPV